MITEFIKPETDKEKRKQFTYFLLLAGSVLVIVLMFTPTLITWMFLVQSNTTTINQLNNSLTNIFQPNAGQEQVLPFPVQQMLSLMQTYHISSYQISNQMDRDPNIPQRIIESAWPRRMDRKSPYLFCLLEEIKSYPNCTVIDQREAVALVYCH